MSNTPSERDDPGPWAKLRRRKVVQWSLAYAAGAWALVQVIGFAADAFHWQDTVKQLSMVVAAIGLPIAVTLAWYHGDRGEQRVNHVELAVLTLLLFIGGGLVWYLGNRSTQATSSFAPTAAVPASISPVAAADPRPSIAVLPFVNMSADQEQEYFSDGLSEQMLDLLSHVPQLRVIARTSSFSFKGKNADAQSIARSLGVSHLLEGSVRKSGNRLRISANLVRSADGSQLWSEVYDRNLEDVFKIQDEIAGAVVAKLKVEMLGAPPRIDRVTSPDAYADYLKAQQLSRSGTEKGLAQATTVLEHVVAVDDEFVPGWQLLSRTYADRAWFGFLPLHAGFAQARASIQRAIEIDPSDPAAIVTLASLTRAYDMNLPETARLLKRALSLAPHDPTALRAAANLMTTVVGDFERADKIYDELARLDPLNPDLWSDIGFGYIVAGRYGDAIHALRTSLALAPDAVMTHELLGEAYLAAGDLGAALAEMQKEPHAIMQRLGLSLVYAAMGRRDEAERLLEEVARNPEWASPIAAGYAQLGKTDEAFAWLARALQERDGGVLEVRNGPLFRPLRADTRWQQVLQRIGMSDEQVAALDFHVDLPW